MRPPTAIRVIWIALAAGLMTACGRWSPATCGPGGVVAPGCDLPPQLFVLVSPANATIDVGMTIQMVDTIRTNLTSPAYTLSWSSSDTTKAGVNANGLVRGKAVSPGVAICATLGGMGYSTQSCATVIVQSPPSNFGPALETAPTRRRVVSP
jgi:hypothetical protein